MAVFPELPNPPTVHLQLLRQSEAFQPHHGTPILISDIETPSGTSFCIVGGLRFTCLWLPRISVAYLSHLSCFGSQQRGTWGESLLQQTLSSSADHLQSPGASLGQVPGCRSSARWTVLSVSVTLQECSVEKRFLSCFKSLALLWWQGRKISTPTRHGTCPSSSPSVVCCSWDCWGTWGSCWPRGSAPAALRRTRQTALLCESSRVSCQGAPGTGRESSAFSAVTKSVLWMLYGGMPSAVVNAITGYSNIWC